MNSFTLVVHSYQGQDMLIMHEITFHDVNVIRLLIDGEDISSRDPLFEGSLVVFDELEKSRRASGCYLIFTCACGIAEDGGWEGVEVNVSDEFIYWDLAVGNKRMKYVFDRSEYDSEIEAAKLYLSNSPYPIAPTDVIFPEHFHR
jgi:hypothetical protein